MKKGWSLKKLSEACLINPKKNEIKSQLNDEDLVSFLPMNDLGIQEKKVIPKQTKRLEEVYKGYTYFADNDVLLAKVTPCFENGKLGIVNNLVNGFGFGSSEYIVLRTLGDILPEYLFYFLSTEQFREKGSQLMFGACGLKRLSKDYVDNALIKYPSLSEQQRIVKILDTTFAKIDTIKQNAERNLQNAKELFQSLLKKELNGKNKWPVTKIIEVCTLKSGNSLSQTLFSEKGEIPYIKVAEMNLVENIPQITSSPYMVKRKNVLKAIFPKGSIIFPKRGGAIATNKKRITNVEICADLNIMGIIPNNTIKSEYLYYYFLNVDLGKLSNGTTIPQINNGDIAPLKIFLPPLSEQEQIVTKLDSLSEKCKELENNYRQTITDCDEMKKSILAKAFNGEL